MKKILYVVLLACVMHPLFASCSDEDEIVTDLPNVIEPDSTVVEESKLTFHNPVMYVDMPDPTLVRVGDDYYMVSTTMHFCPSNVVLHSKDLVGWEIIGHVYKDGIGECPAAYMEKCNVSTVHGHSHYHTYDDDLGIQQDDIYSEGSWASSLAYHDGYFYCLWNITQDDMSFISRTKDPAGDWEIISECNPMFYDSSLFFDDDGTAYICRAHDEKIYRLDSNLDLNTAVAIYDFSEDRGQYNETEGYHMFKLNGYYFITMVQWIDNIGSCVEMRSENVDGPYVPRLALSGLVQDEDGNYYTTGGVAQGRIIDSSDTDSTKYFGFFAANNGPLGRTPVLANVTFTPRGMPIFGNEGKSVSYELEAPVQKYGVVSTSIISKSDDFNDTSLDPVWEWNHTPDNDCWSLTANPGNLLLCAVHICSVFFHARNSLTQRTQGPISYGSISMDVSHMNDGDYAGIAMLQYRTGMVGVKKVDGKYYLYMEKGIQNFGKFVTDDLNDGDYFGALQEYEVIELDDTNVNLRVEGNFNTNKATFYYESNGLWRAIGESMTMTYDLINFVGNRFAIFNYATQTTGGYVDIDSFTFEAD